MLFFFFFFTVAFVIYLELLQNCEQQHLHGHSRKRKKKKNGARNTPFWISEGDRNTASEITLLVERK